MVDPGAQGAASGMLSGVICTLVYMFIDMGWFFIPGTNWASNTAAAWLLGIPPESLGALINFTTAKVVSRLPHEPPEHIQNRVEHVRIAREAGMAAAH